jgi:tRNA (guanine-N7-)-methyltransferase
MGRNNKLKRFAEILSFSNVYECYDVQAPVLVNADLVPVQMQGKWKSDFFKNENPITIELACGGGEYTIALAQRYPERNFIGVDLKGNRIWKGASIALEKGLTNVAFLRTHIEVLELFFEKEELDEIWITFPDPYPRPGQENRRLTSARFHEKYRSLIVKGGLVHLKHDDLDFFHYSRQIVERDPLCTILYQNEDIYAGALAFPELDISTYYEGLHLARGRTIKYLRYLIH